MITFFKKIKQLLKLLDCVDYVKIDDHDQITIRLSKNVLIDVEGSAVFRSSNHMVVKSGNDNNGLLFLNPLLENSDDVQDIIKQSKHDHLKRSEEFNSANNNESPCSI